MRIAAICAVCLMAGGMVFAQAPASSERPVLRPGSSIADVIVMQPGGAAAQQAQNAAPPPSAQQGGGLLRSLRPLFKPRSVEQRGRAARKAARRGAVCGDLAIQGEAVGNVPGRIQGCGVADAVRVRSVSGVVLSQSSVMDCRTADALKTWIERSAKPALARKGGGLKSLRVAAHYACRTRNNLKGARISEHGKGRAIDISGFRLQDGSEISVLKGWHARGSRKALRRMHKEACGPFGTVLGPQADRFHRDHFHFDTARHRSGPYCR